MKKINKGLYSSKRKDWATPWELFNRLDKKYQFSLDVCASAGNAKVPQYFDKIINGLKQDWGGHRCWMNPPYGPEIMAWVKKASESGAVVVVGLLPARTDTRWFHNYVYGKAEIIFIKGRIKFVGAENSAPFPSMIAIWRCKK